MQQANPKLDDSYDTLSGNEVAPVYSNPGHTAYTQGKKLLRVQCNLCNLQ